MLTGMVRKLSVEHLVWVKWWGITLQKAQETIQATAQRGIVTMLHTSLSRWFRTNDHNLHYHPLVHSVFSYMMFASTVFRRGNRCAKVYATDFGWATSFPMASRRKAHETSSLLFKWDGVPPVCICDTAVAMIQCKFYQKLKDAACQLKQLEPYTPWSNTTEGLKSLRKRQVESCCSQEHQSTYGTSA